MTFGGGEFFNDSGEGCAINISSSAPSSCFEFITNELIKINVEQSMLTKHAVRYCHYNEPPMNILKKTEYIVEYNSCMARIKSHKKDGHSVREISQILYGIAYEHEHEHFHKDASKMNLTEPLLKKYIIDKIGLSIVLKRTDTQQRHYLVDDQIIVGKNKPKRKTSKVFDWDANIEFNVINCICLQSNISEQVGDHKGIDHKMLKCV